MKTTRREFLHKVGLASVSGAALGASARPARASEVVRASPDALGVLVDIPNCIGCRKCEYACKEAAGFEVQPIETFDDKSVFDEPRRPQPQAYTVINRYANPEDEAKPIYVKNNCMHRVHPACVSACLVGALRKQPNGAVIYDAWKCMGCRYCMVSCPFEIPTYEYDNALTPQVRKCTLCFERISQEGGLPACVKICPQECLTFGRRSELLELAHEKIAAYPEQYLDHVYGEHEAGGTSWLYVAGQPFEQLGLLKLGPQAPPALTEAIQHGVFKYWMPPVAWYGLLGAIMLLSQRGTAGQVSAVAGEAAGLPVGTGGAARQHARSVAGGDGHQDQAGRSSVESESHRVVEETTE